MRVDRRWYKPTWGCAWIIWYRKKQWRSVASCVIPTSHLRVQHNQNVYQYISVVDVQLR